MNPRFISFLKGTLGKMVGLELLRSEDINLSFWDAWPRKFYNIKSYDQTKVRRKKEKKKERLKNYKNKIFKKLIPIYLLSIRMSLMDLTGTNILLLLQISH